MFLSYIILSLVFVGLVYTYLKKKVSSQKYTTILLSFENCNNISEFMFQTILVHNILRM